MTDCEYHLLRLANQAIGVIEELVRNTEIPRLPLRELERLAIIQALKEQGTRQKAAEVLDITVATLKVKMRYHNLLAGRSLTTNSETIHSY